MYKFWETLKGHLIVDFTAAKHFSLGFDISYIARGLSVDLNLGWVSLGLSLNW